ncbi:hypothetical protein CAPTEDRAFT_224641 [Capitella teleta]|uniref:C2H2-type domain-containing protein n=1 Tax=Capitella teleta TaxID=283909 RepID=R7UST5_CAPTE|nr:hypothetical protein CAPTEDRAFT_224641 [Capitella teleta]|eukprot:ELU06977.1 hypothetical protein CAPTEDRAFT_224641 [Capitella teleta]
MSTFMLLILSFISRRHFGVPGCRGGGDPGTQQTNHSNAASKDVPAPSSRRATCVTTNEIYTAKKPKFAPLNKLSQCKILGNQLRYPTSEELSRIFCRSRRSKNAENKPFKCPFPGCSSSFYQKFNLTAHRKTKHAEPAPTR